MKAITKSDQSEAGNGREIDAKSRAAGLSSAQRIGARPRAKTAARMRGMAGGAARYGAGDAAPAVLKTDRLTQTLTITRLMVVAPGGGV